MHSEKLSGVTDPSTLQQTTAATFRAGLLHEKAGTHPAAWRDAQQWSPHSDAACCCLGPHQSYKPQGNSLHWWFLLGCIYLHTSWDVASDATLTPALAPAVSRPCTALSRHKTQVKYVQWLVTVVGAISFCCQTPGVEWK